MVRYRLVPHASMPTGPVSIILTGHQLVVAVDSRCIDPHLTPTLEKLGAGIMEPRARLATPDPSSRTSVRIHCVSDTELAAADVQPGTIDVLVNKELICAELAADLSRHATQIMRYFT